MKSSILDRDRTLTIDKNYIEFDDTDLVSKPPTKFTKDSIGAFRYGINWIHGYQFIIGRIYCIDIKDSSGKIIKLRLKSIYGVRKKLLAEKYTQIVNALYDNFFDDIIRAYLAQFDNHIDFELGGLLFSQAGIAFDSKSEPVSWNNIGTSSYTTYYTIYPKSDPYAYKAFEYLHYWNAGIVYSVSRQILKDKGMYSE